MPNWTKEQQLAIDKDNTNIIVSAGAGSGKTAVLTARVLRKLKTGVNINELLILTFTKKAAEEMKERIRKSISKDDSLKEQLDYIDSSYITTFDSFALSIVKKYHYLLNIPSNVKIIDASLLYIEKVKILDSIFEELYKSKDKEFLKLIDDLTIKDDDDIKKYILDINSKLDLKFDKDEYLDKYIDNYYSDSFIDKSIKDFENILKEKISSIKELFEKLELYTDSEFMENMYDAYKYLFESDSYDEMIHSLDVKPPRLPGGTCDEAKSIKDDITKMINNLKEIMRFENTDDIKNTYLSTKEYILSIKKIINILDKKINEYKDKSNLYDFTDISKMLIRILKEKEEVREELKKQFNEIMVDEYQDTSDLQEEFISMIQNNNVYIVGDIKQSIYRFRNANPYLFKSKYDNYSKNNGGFKIDLTNNFRSRMEVVSIVNLLFTNLMTDSLGGANYEESHKMIYGNKSYIEKGLTKENYNMELYNYNYDKECGFTKEEIEAFFVARDIQNKINSKYPIFDKDEGIIRCSTYSDFAILLDKSSYFDLYKKIFEYFKIPITKYTSTNITTEVEISLIKNILKLIICAYNKNYDIEFRYSFFSIARSYLFNYSDEELFELMKNNSFYDTEIMKKIYNISNDLSIMSLNEIIYRIIYDFDFYNKQILVGDVDKRIKRIDQIISIFKNLSDASFDIYSALEYLEKVIEENYKLEINDVGENSNSVKIMTIHASKGLEFPVCYFASLHSKFNIRELNEMFLYNNKYGIVAPFYKEGVGVTFLKDLVKDNYIKEEISEKIRLFYVALTRPKEKVIMVTSLKEECDNKMINSRSFLDMLMIVKDKIGDYIYDLDLNSLELTTAYDVIKEYNYKDNIDKTSNRVIEKNINVPVISNNKSKASKEVKALLTKEEKEKMKFGTKIHEVLEHLDFNKPNISNYDIPKYFKDKILSFIKELDLDKVKNIYKEYEFIYKKGIEEKHGIIDLILEYDDVIKIVDYKLKNIDDLEYKKQLNDYKDFVSLKSKKRIEVYLFSIVDGEFKKLD